MKNRRRQNLHACRENNAATDTKAHHWLFSNGYESLEWANTPATTKKLADVVEAHYGPEIGTRRYVAAETIFEFMELGLHRTSPYKETIIALASWLAMTGGCGDEVLAGTCTHCRFDTLPPEGPDHRAILVFSTANIDTEGSH